MPSKVIRPFAALILAILVSAYTNGAEQIVDIRLDYDAGFPGSHVPSPSIMDANGLETGFTHRLPGTGAAIIGNDPNITIDANALNFRGTPGSPATDTNLDSIDLLAHYVPNPIEPFLHDNYIIAGLHLTDVHLGPNGQAGVFIGRDVDHVYLVGIRSIDAIGNFEFFATFIEDGFAYDQGKLLSYSSEYVHAPGTDVSFTFGRATSMPGDASMMYAFADTDDTVVPYDAFSSVSSYMAYPLGYDSSLYVGVFHFDDAEHSIKVANYYVSVVIPEPSTYILAICGVLGVFFARRVTQ